MKKLHKPIHVGRGQRNYLNEEQFQDYTEQQLNNIFNYLDSDILLDDENNTKTTLTFDVNFRDYSALEIHYQTSRNGYLVKGSQIITNPVGSCLNVNVLFRITTTKMVGDTSLYSIGENSITLVAGSAYEFTDSTTPYLNTNNNTYITGVRGYK